MKTKSQIFKQAHQLAKQFEGNYTACFSEALKIVYYDLKKLSNINISNEAKERLEIELTCKYGIYSAFIRDTKIVSELKQYSYKFWELPFTGYQMFFSNDFINQLNK